jgi:hypothetical protein
MQNARAGKRAEKSSRATVALGASRGIIQCDALQIVGIILIAYVILHFIIKFWVTPQPTLPTAALAHGQKNDLAEF